MNPAPRGTAADGQLAADAVAAHQDDIPRSRSAASRYALAVCALLLFATFAALGTWQVQRLYWKLDLIARVEQRVHAPAVIPPARDHWTLITSESDEYRHIRLAGVFLPQFSAKVQASTVLGSGWWLLTPMRLEDGSTVLVNRGFVPARADDWNGHAPLPSVAEKQQTATVTGLLRISEPGGGFLRHNDPAAGRWYSRDVQAIAAARGLSDVAPYFVDADADGESGSKGAEPAADHPVGGLTVVSFHNSHLVYALTWYALALMVAGAFIWVARQEKNLSGRDR
ncbi:SURF1 family protein [Undibacterium sp. TJN25]|uniref:SURF1 family protein n=1 Tax=Undibacterium sp. TJN25 TaxID=3413056 RepID=UPI003BF41D90